MLIPIVILGDHHAEITVFNIARHIGCFCSL